MISNIISSFKLELFLLLFNTLLTTVLTLSLTTFLTTSTGALFPIFAINSFLTTFKFVSNFTFNSLFIFLFNDTLFTRDSLTSTLLIILFGTFNMA